MHQYNQKDVLNVFHEEVNIRSENGHNESNKCDDWKPLYPDYNCKSEFWKLPIYEYSNNQRKTENNNNGLQYINRIYLKGAQQSTIGSSVKLHI